MEKLVQNKNRKYHPQYTRCFGLRGYQGERWVRLVIQDGALRPKYLFFSYFEWTLATIIKRGSRHVRAVYCDKKSHLFFYLKKLSIRMGRSISKWMREFLPHRAEFARFVTLHSVPNFCLNFFSGSKTATTGFSSISSIPSTPHSLPPSEYYWQSQEATDRRPWEQRALIMINAIKFAKENFDRNFFRLCSGYGNTL